MERSSKLTLRVMDLDHALRIDPPAALTAESTVDQEYLSSIEEQFKGTSKAHASTLILKMLTTKYDGVSGVREHIMMMSDMANKLKGMDMEISEGKDYAKNRQKSVKTGQYRAQDWKSTSKAGSKGIFL
nr:hypothetical protein [Tanacetum cinerariifolium]